MTTSTNNPGCLAALLRLLGIPTKPASEPEAESYPYRVRDDFLSPAEQSFYLVIKGMMGDHLIICPKVSLADIFFVIRPNENLSAYNRINRKHVDFLVCNPKTMKPRFAIELDDQSHARADREERDEFVDGVFKQAGLPLVHVPVRQSYGISELGDLFREALRNGDSNSSPKNPPEVQPQAMADKTVSAPSCPKCGVPMVLRTARQGSQSGKQFYGCPNYPNCRTVLPFSG